MTIARNLLPLPALLLGACIDAPAWDTFPPPSASLTDTAPSTSPTFDDPPTATSDESTPTTVDPPMSSSGAPDDTTETSPEPAILEPVVLTPNPISVPGLIDVAVHANEHTEGVRMQIDAGAAVELDLLAPGKFRGAIAAFTGLDNDDYVATLTPWRGSVAGEAVTAAFKIELPEPGSEGFWESGDLIGPGRVAAVGVLPDGHVLELGTLSTGDGARCYLRRRDKGGVWFLDEVIDLLPNIECSAIDLAVDPEGAVYVLAERKVGNEPRWWLARLPTWQAKPAQVGLGASGETAVALAAHPSGMIAACGFAPSSMSDEDAKAWLFRPNQPGESRTFDYWPLDKDLPHSFNERTRDCVFTDDTLVLVGETHGKHGTENQLRDRLFILKVNTNAPANAAWIVAPAGVRPQSGAQAVAVDDLGRLVVAGFTCDDICTPEGDLRIYDLADELSYLAPLGVFPTKQFAVQDLAWSPAGYAVVATGGMKGNEAAFTVRAFHPAKINPVWTFKHEDGGKLYMALALAIGPYGEVYAGGFGENGYPAVAYIGG